MLRLLLGRRGLLLRVLLGLQQCELLGSQRDDGLLGGECGALLLQLLRLSGEEFLQSRTRFCRADGDDDGGLAPQWHLGR
ncbi:hypothetical protein GCM10027414_14190 [Humibacter ginsengiterrae]